MKTYRVTLTTAGAFLASFCIWAPNLKAARQQAQTEKQLFCMYDTTIPAHLIKTTTRHDPTQE